MVVEKDARDPWSKRFEFVRVRCCAGVWMDGDGGAEPTGGEQVCRMMDGEAKEEGEGSSVGRGTWMGGYGTDSQRSDEPASRA